MEPADVVSLGSTCRDLRRKVRDDRDYNRGLKSAICRGDLYALDYYIKEDIYSPDDFLMECLQREGTLDTFQYLLGRFQLTVTHTIMNSELIHYCTAPDIFKYIFTSAYAGVYDSVVDNLLLMQDYKCLKVVAETTDRYDRVITVDTVPYPAYREALNDYYELLKVLVKKPNHVQSSCRMVNTIFQCLYRPGSLTTPGGEVIVLTDGDIAHFIEIAVDPSGPMLSNMSFWNTSILKSILELRYFETYRVLIKKYNILNLLKPTFWTPEIARIVERVKYTVEEIHRLYRYNLEVYGNSYSHFFTSYEIVNSPEFPTLLKEYPQYYDTPEFFKTMVQMCKNDNILLYSNKYLYTIEHLVLANEVSIRNLQLFCTAADPKEVCLVMNTIKISDVTFLEDIESDAQLRNCARATIRPSKPPIMSSILGLEHGQVIKDVPVVFEEIDEDSVQDILFAPADTRYARDV